MECVRVCDNLVGGVPACVVANFYPDLSYEEEVEELERERAGLPCKEVVDCRHFVRSDVYSPVVKHGCYFGVVTCVHLDVEGFGACAGCSRFS
jgi:hypothetical protein